MKPNHLAAFKRARILTSSAINLVESKACYPQIGLSFIIIIFHRPHLNSTSVISEQSLGAFPITYIAAIPLQIRPKATGTWQGLDGVLAAG